MAKIGVGFSPCPHSALMRKIMFQSDVVSKWRDGRPIKAVGTRGAQQRPHGKKMMYATPIVPRIRRERKET